MIVTFLQLINHSQLALHQIRFAPDTVINNEKSLSILHYKVFHALNTMPVTFDDFQVATMCFSKSVRLNKEQKLLIYYIQGNNCVLSIFAHFDLIASGQN